MKQPSLVVRTLLSLSLACLAGCASDRTRIAVEEGASAPAGVARIGHVVLLKLKDPGGTRELLDSSRASLARIPGVTHFGVGTHLETGRDTVDKDYHVALYLGFDTEEDYSAYVVHPNHGAYVETWLPRLESIRVFDVVED